MAVKVELANVGREVQNLVASLNFYVSLKLPEVARILGADYDPSNFPGAIYRKREGYTFLLFRNGKSVLVTSQARSEPMSMAKRETLSDVEREFMSGRSNTFLVMVLAKILFQ